MRVGLRLRLRVTVRLRLRLRARARARFCGLLSRWRMLYECRCSRPD